MPYIFKQKLQLSDLAGLELPPKRILIYEPKDDLGALYAYHLRAHNFEIQHCQNLEAVRQFVIDFGPQLLIFSVEEAENLPQIRLIPADLIKEFPGLQVISTSYNLTGQGLSDLMATGIISHINRRLSRPQDLAVLVKTVLR